MYKTKLFTNGTFACVTVLVTSGD